MSPLTRWFRKYRASEMCVDVKALGARGDSVSDDTKIIQKAVQTVYDKGGGIVCIPPLADGNYYRITRPIYVRDRVTIRGSGYSSFVKNDRTTSDEEGDTGVFLMGNYRARTPMSILDEKSYSLADVMTGDVVVTLISAPEAAEFNVGDVVFLWSASRDEARHPIPLDQDMNEITGIDKAAGKLVLKYPVGDSIADASIARSTGKLKDPFGNPIKAVKQARVENLRLENSTRRVWGLFLWGGMFECTVRNIWATSQEVFFSCNAVARTTVENIYVSGLTRKLFDIAYFSIGSTFRNVSCEFAPSAALKSPLIVIANGGAVRDNTYENFRTNIANADRVKGARVLQISSLRCVFRGIHTNLQSIKAPKAAWNVKDTGTIIARGNIIESCITQCHHADIHLVEVSAAGASNAPNIIRGNLFIGPADVDLLHTSGPDINLIFEDNYA